MQQRLQALDDAVNIVSPPLDKFYASLSDEQKARFNNIAPPAPPQANAPKSQAGHAEPASAVQCQRHGMADRSDRSRGAPERCAAGKARCAAVGSRPGRKHIKAACPTELPATPPDRLAAIGKRLDAMLQGVNTVRPALAAFYDSLSDEQKAHFDGMGRQLFAANQE